MRDTPRTDAIVLPFGTRDGYIAMADLARQLERELAAAKAELGKFSERNVYALRDRIKIAEAERDALRDMKAWLRSNVIALTTRDADGCERASVALSGTTWAWASVTAPGPTPPSGPRICA